LLIEWRASNGKWRIGTLRMPPENCHPGDGGLRQQPHARRQIDLDDRFGWKAAVRLSGPATAAEVVGSLIVQPTLPGR
jgi:hypothetical protein